jgi:hypothetical protein
MDRERRLRTGIAVALFLLFAAASLHRIESYDYFWHLATGRWIADNGALPASDPFAVASDRGPWINGSWLFQAAAAAIWKSAGHEGNSVARALLIGLLFLLLFRATARHTGAGIALLLVAIAWHGALHRLGARPEMPATLLLLAATLVVLGARSTERPWWQPAAAYGALTVVWVNLHPSALLAPLVAGIVLAGELAARPRDWRATARSLAPLAVVGGAALAVNPWGYLAVVAPLQLAQFVTSAPFQNLEWLPTRLTEFPLVYAAVVAGAVAFVLSPQRRRELASAALFLFFSFLAIRFVRNHGFFFALAPLLVAPLLRPPQKKSVALLAAAAGLAIVASGAALSPWGTGVDSAVYPHRSASRLAALPVEGTVYNADQFGGYLIWRFYPERRVVVDGRNELFRSFLHELGEARLDSRKWNALLARYGVTAAVEEYAREPLEVVDHATGTKEYSAPSLAYFPRREWALVGFDDVAMVLVRRDALPGELLSTIEYAALVPDDPSPRFISEASRQSVLQEVARHRREFGWTARAARLEHAAAELVN